MPAPTYACIYEVLVNVWPFRNSLDMKFDFLEAVLICLAMFGSVWVRVTGQQWT